MLKQLILAFSRLCLFGMQTIDSCSEAKTVPQELFLCCKHLYCYSVPCCCLDNYFNVTVHFLSQNKVHVKEGNTRQPTHEAKNKSGVLEFTELSENVSIAFVDEVLRSGPVS